MSGRGKGLEVLIRKSNVEFSETPDYGKSWVNFNPERLKALARGMVFSIIGRHTNILNK